MFSRVGCLIRSYPVVLSHRSSGHVHRLLCYSFARSFAFAPATHLPLAERTLQQRTQALLSATTSFARRVSMPNASTDTSIAAADTADVVMASPSEVPAVQSEEIKTDAIDGATTDADADAELCALMRTVQTQHGDYRTVDEENIVVLTRSWTPELSDEQLTADAIWVQPDALGRDADEVSAFDS